MTPRAFVIGILCVALTHAVQWDAYNNPNSWSGSFAYSLKKFPTAASVKNTPWSDTYWPSYMGGIANRWQDTNDNTPGFNYTLYTKAQLKSGSVDINILSPAEKYDILNARYDYPTVHGEWSRCSPNDPTWEGLCHGWSPAAIIYEQPNNLTLTNSDGIKVPIGSSDVKAFLIYFLGVYAFGEETTNFIAQRCNIDIRTNTSAQNVPACWDSNPGTFHVMIGNLIGLQGHAFVGDIDRSIQVWNQPISGYNYTLDQTAAPFPHAAPGTVKQQHVTFTILYSKEEAPDFYPHPALTFTDTYTYWLDLDKNGRILGGKWGANDFDRLDFIWMEQQTQFYGYCSLMQTVYTDSVTNTTTMPSGVAPSVANLKPTPVAVGATFGLSSYDDSTRKAWTVAAGTKALKLHFNSFGTRRQMDTVRVYEMTNGKPGALVAVLHGASIPADVVLSRGTDMLVVFSVNMKAGKMVENADQHGTGFSATVTSV